MCNYSPIRISFLLITLFITVLHTPLFAEDIEKNGNIHGAVTTSDGTAAAFVTVQIKSLSKGTLTNEEGHFSFSRLKPGSYTLSVSLTGYETIEQTVEVEEGKTAKLSIRLTVSRSQLQEVVVSSARGRLVNKNTDYVARMPISNLENPQVYSVVNKELLKEQVIVDAKEALRNAVGAAPVTYPAGGLAISSRGFTTSVNARNGMETVASRSSFESETSLFICRMSMCKLPGAAVWPPMLYRPPPMLTGPGVARTAAAISATLRGSSTCATVTG